MSSSSPGATTQRSSPPNIAVGWIGSNLVGHTMPDFQQRVVIDSLVKTVVELARESDNPDNDFRFAGCAWDVPARWVEYYRNETASETVARQQRPIPGGSSDPNASAVWHPAITLDYSTLGEGVLRYYLHLKKALQREFPDRTIYFIYEPWTPKRWTSALEASPLSQSERRLIAGDALFSESPSLTFLEQPALGEITATGWFTKNSLGSTTPNLENDYDKHLEHLRVLAGVHGVWFNSFGRFDGGGTDIATRARELVLARLIPHWDNLNGVPLSERSWDANAKVYRSPTSYADKHVLYSRPPGTGTRFGVFRASDGEVRLSPGETVADIRRTNELFEPVYDGTAELKIDGSTVSVLSSESCGKCYILTTRSTN